MIPARLIFAHIFEVGLSDLFFRLGSTNVTPHLIQILGYTSGTLSISVNVSDSDINNLIVKSPGTHENDPPPTGATFIFYHGSRMFATDGENCITQNSMILNPLTPKV